jgi:hypothetical protein
MKQKIGLSILVLTILTLFVFFFNAKIVKNESNVTLQEEITTICNQKFSSINLVTSLKGIHLTRNSTIVSGLPLPVLVPNNIILDDSNTAVAISFGGKLNYPLLPDLPILPINQANKICPYVKQYADLFYSKKLNLIPKVNSKIFNLNFIGNRIDFSLKSNYQSMISSKSLQLNTRQKNIKTMIEAQYQSQKPLKPIALHDFIIFYEYGYGEDVQKLVDFYNQKNIRTLAVELTQLPGYAVGSPIPTECQGEFLKECYHFWGDPAPGISQLAVPSLPGYVAHQTAFTPYQKTPFIPGLIRAFVRMKKKQNPLRGIMLIGSSQKIPPYNSSTMQYYYDGLPWLSDGSYFPNMKVFTDLYYSIPDVPLVEQANSMAHQIRTPGIWSCSGPNGVRLDYWCNQDEWRHWPNPPLTAYRNPAHVPDGKVYDLKYGFMDPYWDTFQYSDVVPVGRLVTPGKYMNGRSIVADYAEKIERWNKELPSMLNTSIASHGGSTNDSWIYTKSDIDQFQTTFGVNSKVFASEFFVASTKCAGRCVYQPSQVIMDEIGSKNMAAFHLNGHGGHIAIQGPYANGNVSSTYLNEKAAHLDDGLRLKLFEYPTDTTLKQIEDHGKLVGVVFANSCSPSDYLIKNQFEYLARQALPTASIRSWAEQWIAMKDSGAMNTFLNGNVGWGGSDNDYNVAYMQKIKSSWQNCGTLGDAQRLLILDGLRDGYTALIGKWQLLNRHFLGSPLNHVAKLPRSCSIIIKDVDLVEDITIGRN